MNEDTIPNWDELKKTEYKNDKTCVVCGKPKMNLQRYKEHMYVEHDVNMESEDVDIYDYEEAREDWINIVAQADDEKKKKLSCDYDSEAGKRYSDIESEEETVTEKTTPYKPSTSYASDLHSSRSSTSDSSS